MNKLRLRRGDHLIRDGVRFKTLSRPQEGRVNLENVTDGSVLTLADDALLAEYSQRRLEIDRRQELVSPQAEQLLEADFDSLREKARETAEFRLLFVREMLRDPRRRWSNENLKELIDKICIDKGFTKRPSPRSLRRWADRARSLGFEEIGDVRILVPRNHACGGTRDKFGAQVQAIMDAVIDDLVMVPERCPGVEAYAELGRRLEEKHEELTTTFGASTPTFVVPSKRTFYRRLRQISVEEVTLAREGRLEADKRHSLVGLGPQGSYPLHEVEIDHTTVDVIVVCPLTGVPIGRPTITLALDRWSRMVVGVHVGLEAPGWRAVMLCLRNTILPKDELLAADPENLRASGSWLPFGVMDILVMDNAAEFHCAALRNGALQLGITLQFCPAGQPRYKGKTERLFRRMNVELFHQLPGTTFSNPAQRKGYDSKAEACFTLEQVRALVHRWIVDFHSRKEHSFTQQTPNERWEEGIRRRGGATLPVSAAEVMLSLANVEYRKLTRKGIELYGLHYSDPRNPQLRELLNHPEAPRAVKVRVHDDDLAAVHVEDFRNPGMYVPVPCTDQDYAKGLSLAEHHLIAARARAQLKPRQAATMAMLAEAKAQLRKDIAKVRDAKKLTSRNLNAVYPALTGKVTDIGPDGNPVAVIRAPAKPQGAVRPIVPAMHKIQREEFWVSSE